MDILLKLIYLFHILISCFIIVTPFFLPIRFLPSAIFILILLISNSGICWVSKLEESIEYWECQNIHTDSTCKSLNTIISDVTGVQIALQDFAFIRNTAMVLLLFYCVWKLQKYSTYPIQVPTSHLVALSIGVLIWLFVELYHGLIYIELPVCEAKNQKNKRK